jgi:hypothetical protein
MGRIIYVGEENLPPIAKIVVTGGNNSVEIGELVVFDATGSVDPDGDTLSYEWTFGDGISVSQASTTVTHAFSTSGYYYVSVIVMDGVGGRDRAYVAIEVGDPS